MSIPDRRYRRGYSPPEHLRDFIHAAQRPATARTVLAALIDVLTIVGAAVLVGAVSTRLPWLVTGCLGVLAAAVVARQTRALENLVHEASHYNWHRKRRRLNDALAVGLAAIPAGVRIGVYRTEHLLHHGRFGTSADVDRVRYEELDLESIDRSSAFAFARDVATRFGPYRRSWYTAAIADPWVAAAPFAWAALTVVAPTGLLLGWVAAVVAAAVWSLGYLVFLPVLRLIAESNEHVYSDSTSVFDATISNTGPWLRLLIHPHGDGFHTVHHLWPVIPHHRVGAVHRMLRDEDPGGYGARLRVRTRLLSKPSPVDSVGLPATLVRSAAL